MVANHNGSSGVGLERSCDARSSDWIHHTGPVGGVEGMAAWLHGRAYRTHRHDTYAISLTDRGIQAFAYRGAIRISTPGEVVVLHPDEPHDGYAGTEAGFGYRQLYVEPALIFKAVQDLCGQRCALPFVRQPVLTSPRLAATIHTAFRHGREPLAIDDLVLNLAAGLLDADPSSRRTPSPRQVDIAAIERARQVLDAERTRVVRSWELETVTGLSRYDLARQFRLVVGTSPYRYSLMRRLGFARARIAQQRPLVDIALEAGFADQAHFTRMFTAAFGITPARYAALHVPAGPAS